MKEMKWWRTINDGRLSYNVHPKWSYPKIWQFIKT